MAWDHAMKQFGDIPSNDILNTGGGDFAEGFAQGFVCHDPIQNRFIVKDLGIFTIRGDITKLLQLGNMKGRKSVYKRQAVQTIERSSKRKV